MNLQRKITPEQIDYYVDNYAIHIDDFKYKIELFMGIYGYTIDSMFKTQLEAFIYDNYNMFIEYDFEDLLKTFFGKSEFKNFFNIRKNIDNFLLLPSPLSPSPLSPSSSSPQSSSSSLVAASIVSKVPPLPSSLLTLEAHHVDVHHLEACYRLSDRLSPEQLNIGLLYRSNSPNQTQYYGSIFKQNFETTLKNFKIQVVRGNGDCYYRSLFFTLLSSPEIFYNIGNCRARIFKQLTDFALILIMKRQVE